MQIIWKDNLPYEDLQKEFIDDAQNNCDKHLEDYSKIPQSYNGTYINSDLMKYTFPIFASNINNRSLYNLQIHNSSAALANELFEREVKSKKYKKCIFIGGTPGAGKSFLTQSLYLTKIIDDETLCFEVNLTTEQIFDKLELVKKSGLEIGIIVVNAPLNVIAENIVKRELEIGRKVGSKLISSILSKLPYALEKIMEKYPNIQLGIYNKSSNYDVDLFEGKESIPKIYHGEYDVIYKQFCDLREGFELEIENQIESKDVGKFIF